MSGQPLAIGLVQVGAVDRGTGFAFSDRLLLTAFHVVRATAGAAEPASGPVTVAFGNDDPISATVRWWDRDADIAVLELATTVPASRRLVTLAAPRESLRESRFQVVGFARDRPFTRSPVTVDGRIVEPLGTHDEGAPILELLSDQIAAGRSPGGLSGGPVLVRARWRDAAGAERSGRVAVGVIRDFQLDPDGSGRAYAGTVYATSLSAVRDRWAEVADAISESVVFGAAEHGDRGPASIADHQLGFAERLVVAARFVGRDELFAEIEGFAAKRDRGYVHLEGSGGLGKSAIAARFAVLQDAPIFFADASAGTVTAVQCLSHLAAELILRHGLDEDLPAAGVRDAVSFSRILAAAVERCDGPLWLVVDGLDEAARARPGANPLLLPASLPAGAYILTTTRTSADRFNRAPGTGLLALRLAGESSEQHRDLRRYVAERVAELDGERGSVDVDELTAAADGNFMYVEYALEDLAAGEALSALPRGLPAYYQARFWQEMEQERERDWDGWDQLYRPVAELLAIAAEPVTATWLALRCGRDAREIEERVIARWSRFLRSEDSEGDGERRWRTVHRSFADFLATELELRRVHLSVARAGIVDPDGYARRHVSEHLVLAGEDQQLLALLRTSDWLEGQAVADPTGALTLQDLDRAATALAQRGGEEASGVLVSTLGDEVWCALAATSIRTTLQSTPPALMAAYVETGQWTLDRAVRTARLLPDPDRRALSFAALARWDEELFDEALRAVEQIADRGALRARTLGRFAGALPGELRAAAVTSTFEWAIRLDDYEAPYAISSLVPWLDDDQLRRACELAVSVVSDVERTVLCLALAPRCPALADTPEAREALSDQGLPPEVLDVLAASGEPATAAQLGTAVLDDLQAAVDTADLGWWLLSQRNIHWLARALAPHVSLEDLERLVPVVDDVGAWLEDALAPLAGALVAAGGHERALAAVAGRPSLEAVRTLVSALRTEDLDRLLELAREIRGSYDRAEAIALVALALPPEHRTGALEDAAPGGRFADANSLLRTIARLGRGLSPSLAAQALRFCEPVRSTGTIADALRELAPVLEPTAAKLALNIARGLVPDDKNDLPLAALLPRVSQETVEAFGHDITRLNWPARPRPVVWMALGRRLGADFATSLVEQEVLGPREAEMVVAIGPRLTEAQVRRLTWRLDVRDSEELEELRTAYARARDPEPSDEDPMLFAERGDAAIVTYLVPELVGAGRIDDALTLIDQIRYGWLRVQAVEHVAAEVDAVAAARSAWHLGGWGEEVTLLELVAPQLDPELVEAECLRLETVAKTLAARRRATRGPQSDRSALVCLWTYLPEPARSARVDELLTWSDHDDDELASMMSVISARRTPLPAPFRAALYPLWVRLLQAAAQRSRADAIAMMSQLAPLASQLGGPDGVDAVAEALIDLGERWP